MLKASRISLSMICRGKIEGRGIVYEDNVKSNGQRVPEISKRI